MSIAITPVVNCETSSGSLPNPGYGCTRTDADEEGSSGFGRHVRVDARFQDAQWSRGSPADRVGVASVWRSDSDRGNWTMVVPTGHQKTLKTVRHATLRRAKVPYFRIYDLRSTYATRLSAGGVADEWVTQLLRRGDAKVFKKYSQMKREALQKLNRQANQGQPSF